MLKDFIKNSGWILGANIGTKVISFILLAILARLLTPAEFALYFILLSVAGSINQISDFGMAISVHQITANLLGSGDNKKIGGIFATSVFIILLAQLISTVLILIFPEKAYELLFNGKGEYTYFLLILPISLLTITSEFPMRIIMGLSIFRWISIRNILVGFGSALIIILITYFGGIKGAILGQIIALSLSTIYSIHLLRKSGRLFGFSFKQTWKLFVQNLQKLYKAGFVMYLGNTFMPALANFYVIALITRYLPNEQFGYIRIASALTSFFSIIPSAMQPVTMSFIAEHEGKESQSTQLQDIQIRYLIGLSLIIALLLITMIPILIPILFGVEYLPGTEFIALLILINIGATLPSGLFGNFLMAQGKGWYVGLWSIFSTLCTVLILYYCMPMVGDKGYLMGHFAGYFIGFITSMAPCLLLFTKRQRHRIITFLVISLLHIFAFALINLFPISPFIKFIFSIILTMSYSFFFYFYAIDAGEKRKILEIATSIYNKSINTISNFKKT